MVGDGEWRPRALIADEDLAVRSAIAARLERDGYQVDQCASGAEVLAYRGELDLLVLDQRVPGSAALELVYLMRQASRRTPVLLMIGQPDALLLDESGRLGVTVL